jgi:hypothetical protein
MLARQTGAHSRRRSPALANLTPLPSSAIGRGERWQPRWQSKRYWGLFPAEGARRNHR